MEIKPHHIKPEVCTTRPSYREGKIPKCVKVYTCAQESNYLLVTKIPAIAVHLELVKLFKIYGEIEDYKILDDYPSEEFTDTILLKFAKIQNARTAKLKLDNYNFFGKVLHVCYAPEFESVDDVRQKINERKFIVSFKCKKYETMKYGTVEYEANKPFFEKNSKKQQIGKKTAKEKKTESVDPLFSFPKVPDGWVKESLTGSSSLDQTSIEINNQLKRTLPAHKDVNIQTQSKKRKKMVSL